VGTTERQDTQPLRLGARPLTCGRTRLGVRPSPLQPNNFEVGTLGAGPQSSKPKHWSATDAGMGHTAKQEVARPSRCGIAIATERGRGRDRRARATIIEAQASECGALGPMGPQSGSEEVGKEENPSR
jgi:hypothetical protein